jgi:tripartite-type tricarboxylate transporter receptor subunit TctC
MNPDFMGRHVMPRFLSSGLRLFVAALLLAVSTIAGAQTKTIYWVVPAPPGGVLDLAGRLIAKKIKDRTGQTVIVENKAGGGGVVAAEYILGSTRPDAIHVLEATQNMAGVLDQMIPDIRYKPIRDLVPVHGLFYLPAVLITQAGKPYSSLKELVEYSRKSGAGLNIGTTGHVGIGHAYSVVLMDATGLKGTLVHYKGSAPAIQDLLVGSIDVMFDYLATAAPHIKSGKLKAITAMSSSRLKELPETSTIIEEGYGSAFFNGWVGAFVKNGTSQEEIASLSKVIRDVLSDPEVIAMNDKWGQILMTDMDHAKFKDFNLKEYERWSAINRKLGIKID